MATAWATALPRAGGGRLRPAGVAAGALLALLLVALAERTVFGGPGAYQVSASRSDIESATNRVVLTGEVEITQNGRRMRAPRMVITFEPAAGGAAGRRRIRHLDADGPAWFTTPDRTARADHASYDAASGNIVLTGGVIVTQGRDVATGDRLVINEAAGVSVMTAAPGRRVRSVIYGGAALPGAPGAH